MFVLKVFLWYEKYEEIENVRGIKVSGLFSKKLGLFWINYYVDNLEIVREID